MGCTNNSDDERYNEERHIRRMNQRQSFQEDIESNNEEEEEFKDFEEVGSKFIK